MSNMKLSKECQQNESTNCKQIFKNGMNRVQDRYYGLKLWESGAVLVISIFRPTMGQKIRKKYKKIQKFLDDGWTMV